MANLSDQAFLVKSRFTCARTGGTRLSNTLMSGAGVDAKSLTDIAINGAKIFDLLAAYEKTKG